MTTLNARANQAYHAIIEEAGENWMGFSHQRDAFEEGWATGYKAKTAEMTSPAVQDRLAQACGDPGSIVGRQHHLDESLSRWQMRAVLHVLAEVSS